jgi:competence protein ComEC
MTVPHHGSKTSSSIAFLNAVSPKISIATAGYLNRFGHPKPTIVERYQALESQIYQSAVDGAVIIDFKQQGLGSPNAKEITLNTWASIYQRYWLDSVKSQP